MGAKSALGISATIAFRARILYLCHIGRATAQAVEIDVAPSFRYLRPSSLLEAISLKAEHGEGAVLWAGGTDLLLQWRRGELDIDTCIDLSGLDELSRIDMSPEAVTIGAMTTLAEVETHPGLSEAFPVLAEMARHFATPQVRALATVGGNLCHAVPSADCAPPLIALDAEVELHSPAGPRSLPLESFFAGPRTTALNDDEILTRVSIPRPASRTACSYRRMVRSSVDIALVGIACRLAVDEGGSITEARVVLGAVAPTPLRSRRAEALLTETAIEDVGGNTLDEIATGAAAEARPISDVRAGAAYRRHMTAVLTRRAVADAARSLAA
jgi:carbon-monoxide dehydrogenase medium subunit